MSLGKISVEIRVQDVVRNLFSVLGLLFDVDIVSSLHRTCLATRCCDALGRKSALVVLERLWRTFRACVQTLGGTYPPGDTVGDLFRGRVGIGDWLVSECVKACDATMVEEFHQNEEETAFLYFSSTLPVSDIRQGDRSVGAKDKTIGGGGAVYKKTPGKGGVCVFHYLGSFYPTLHLNCTKGSSCTYSHEVGLSMGEQKDNVLNLVKGASAGSPLERHKADILAAVANGSK